MTPQQAEEVIKDLASTKAIMLDMHHRLFGNGQPGFVTTVDKRITALEHVEAKGKGALWAATALLGILETVHWIWSKVSTH